MKVRLLPLLTALALPFQLSVASLSDPESGFVPDTDPETPGKGQVQLSYTLHDDADVELPDGGDFSTTRVKLAFDYATERVIGSEGTVRVGAFYEWSDYDFDSPALTDLGLSDEEVDRFTLRMDYSQPFSEGKAWFVTLGANFAAGSDADLDDGITGLGAGGVVLLFSEELTIRLGLGAMSSLEDDALIFPVIAVNWAISDRLRLATFDGVYLTYDLTADQGTVVDTSIRYNRHDIRTSDDEDALLDTSFIASVGVRQRLAESFFVRAFAGFEFERELELFQSGNSQGGADIDDAAVFGLQGMFTF